VGRREINGFQRLRLRRLVTNVKPDGNGERQAQQAD
jgi:hypothetical protein